MQLPRLPAGPRLARVGACVVLASWLLPGCAVITVSSAATSVAVTGASLAAGAAVGTVRFTGRAVGSAIDLATPSSE
ncbi:hypothetical protein WG922_03850 [Ramlibacter sp. AN1015]|uniref:hypothetical protein n=1 Tax=Ramlibacter sp. AN1015 TaxID=3133428 RepID=UPI0030BD80D8